MSLACFFYLSLYISPIIFAPVVSLQWDASGLAGEDHAGSRAGGVYPEVLSHAALP